MNAHKCNRNVQDLVNPQCASSLETGYLIPTVFSQCHRYKAFQVDLFNKVEIALPTAGSLNESNTLNLFFRGDLLIDNKRLPKFFPLSREIFFLIFFFSFLRNL